MKINQLNVNTNNKRKLDAKTTFSGYFACPLKEVHLQPAYFPSFDSFVESFIEKTMRYFDVVVQYKDRILRNDSIKNTTKEFKDFTFRNCWGQDNKVFLENGKLGIIQKHSLKDFAIDLAKKLKIEPKIISNNLEGGNFFLGKKQNGDNIILAGEDAIKNEDKTQISTLFNIKKNNIFTIPQPEEHIDLRIRPLIYPDVLVGDIDLTIEKARNHATLNRNSNAYFDFLESKKLEEEKENKENGLNFATIETIIRSLEKQGFNPIKVPGVLYKNDINYMNALVHQNNDGTLTYITNKSDRMVSGIDFDNIFTEHLKEHVPSVKNVIFMDSDIDNNGHSMLGYFLSKLYGGLHCMSNEKPDFEMWNKLIRKDSN